MTKLPQTPKVALSSSELDELENFLHELAQTAGDIIRPLFRASVDVQNKADIASAASGQTYDPVTEADRNAELAIRQLIRERYPTHGLYGEEFDFEPGTSGLTWVLDPIDGTRSFITGMLHWGVLIALFDGQQSILGGMYQPVLNEMFVGNGHKASLKCQNSVRLLAVRKCTALSDAVVCCTHPDMFVEASERAAFTHLLAQTRMSRFGGDCYHYGMLAMGFVDLCVEASLKPYDIQALIPIIEGAGGVVTTWAGGNPAHGGQIVASAGAKLHEQALQILAPAAC